MFQSRKCGSNIDLAQSRVALIAAKVATNIAADMLLV